MENDKLVCKACGGDASTYGNVKPIGPYSAGFPFIFRFCKDCGEVASIKEVQIVSS